MQAIFRASFIALSFFWLTNSSFGISQAELEQRYSECEPEIIHDSKTKEAKSSGFSLINHLQDAVSEGELLWPLVLAALAGLLTSLSPCVYPLIPITLSIMGTRIYQSHWHGFLTSSSYVLGMSLVYSILGATFAYLGILAGSLMQNPVIMIAIALLFTLLALSMFGLFDLVLPSGLLNRLSRVGGRGYAGAFLMGLVAGIIAAPCTGPVLGFILTFIAEHQNISFGVLLMVAFSLGLGLPFLILGTFSSAIARLPKSGTWMNRVKIFFGAIMLASAIYYLGLGINQLRGSSSQPEELAVSTWHVLDASNAKEGDFLKLLEQAQSMCKPTLVDFYADWCIACKQLDATTFSNGDVKEALKDYFLVRIDASQSSQVLADLQNSYGVTGLPTILFFDRKGQLNTDLRILGFKSPKDFIQEISGK